MKNYFTTKKIKNQCNQLKQILFHNVSKKQKFSDEQLKSYTIFYFEKHNSKTQWNFAELSQKIGIKA
jgi:hypothetical protein